MKHPSISPIQPAFAVLLLLSAAPLAAFAPGSDGQANGRQTNGREAARSPVGMPPGSYSPVPPRGRAVSDHDHARQTTRSGENRSFEELMRAAQSRGRGEYLGVEPDIGRNIYRFKFLRPGGSVVWVDVDGRSGRVVAERD